MSCSIAGMPKLRSSNSSGDSGFGWHVLCAIKSNRTLDGIQVSQWNQRLRHKRYTQVKGKAAGGTPNYYVRTVRGHMHGCPR